MGPTPPFDRPRHWASRESGPTATSAQRARRRSRLPGSAGRALVYSRRPLAETSTSVFAEAGLQLEWTQSGPGAIAEAVGRDVTVCVVASRVADGEELDYLPCLTQADPSLPVIVVCDQDSVQTQRRLRSHRVFYYLVEPLDPAELRAVLQAALHGRGVAPSADW